MIPTILLTALVISSYESLAVQQRITDLKTQGAIAADMVMNSSFFANSDSVELNSQLTQVADIYKGRIMIVDSNLEVIKDTFEVESGKTFLSKDVIQTLKGTISSRVDEVTQYCQITVPITEVSTTTVSGVIYMSFSMQDIYTLSDNIWRIVTTIYCIVGVVLILLVTLYTRVIVKPLKVIAQSFSRVSEGTPSETAAIHGFTEVEAIGDSFHLMMDEVKRQDESRQEFVSNVSHELKTPITSIKLLADSLLMQENVPTELYQEFLGDITTEVERVNGIINDLLSLVKMDKSVANMIISNVNINDFLEAIMKQVQPIAAERNIELVFESFRPVLAEIDDVKLAMAFRNLVENAVKYNYDDGWVRVSLNADHKFFYVKVADSGVGIPEELQDSIFERFFRVDKARSRETGGSGLGLAIARNAVLMHRGAIQVYSKEKEGTIFTVRIPLKYQV